MKKYSTIAENTILMQYWDTIKNQELGYYPENITTHSSKTFPYWKCEKGHSWQRQPVVQNRVKNPCPFCAGIQVSSDNNIAILFPDIVLDWDYSKNKSLPSEYVPRSTYKAYWICHICGHKWQTKIAHRTQDGTGCPNCAKKEHAKKLSTPTIKDSLEEKYPNLLKEWDYNKNNILPSQVYANSSKKVWWICEYGHSWEGEISARTRKNPTGCPFCARKSNTSFPEQALFFYFSKVTTAINRDNSTGEEIDIFLPDLNARIEYNGSFFHSIKNRKEKDLQKKDFFKSQNLFVITITDSSVNKVDQENKIIYVKEYDFEWGIREAFKMIGISAPIINLEKDRQTIIANYLYTTKKNSLAIKVENILEFWDYKKNYPLSPLQIPPYFTKSVWWICARKHNWQNAPSHRIIKDKAGILVSKDCPYCNKIINQHTLYNTKTHSLYHSMREASREEKQNISRIKKSLREKDGEWIEIETNRFPTFISPFATELYYKDYYYKELYAEELNHV